MNTGDERLSRPSYGAWLTYGLGCENQNLPGFVTLCPGLPVADSSNWRSSFLPGIYQGTYLDTRKTKVNELIANIQNPQMSHSSQRQQLDLLGELDLGALALLGELDLGALALLGALDLGALALLLGRLGALARLVLLFGEVARLVVPPDLLVGCVERGFVLVLVGFVFCLAGVVLLGLL